MEHLQNFKDGTHYHNYNVHQTELPLETRDKRQTIVFTESELDKLKAIATARGFSHLSPFLRNMVFIGLKYEKYLNASLRDILK